MTSHRPASRVGPIVTVVAIVALAVVGVGLWYLLFRPAGPAPVSLGSAEPSGVAGGGASITSPGGVAGSSAAGGRGTSGDVISGTWAVDPSIGSFADFSGSFVGYRVRETLASIGATEAVGRTPDVAGSIMIDGTTVTAAELTADLTTLQSDDGRRDGQLRRQALQTEQYPTATFTLTSPVEVGSVPVEGATFDVTVTGDLALHGVTRPVQIPLQARLEGGVVTVAGSLEIAFGDFEIQPPQSMMVLSVEEHGVMELQLQLTRR